MTSTMKYCKDCKHAFPAFRDYPEWSMLVMCEATQEEIEDPVSGIIRAAGLLCKEARDAMGPCGPCSRLFEPRVEESAKQA